MVKQIDKNEARLRRHRRVRNKISGTAARPRLDVFRSAKHIYAQIIDDEQGVTLVSASTMDKDFNGFGGNVEAAAEIGKKVAAKALEKGITEVVFDRGGYVYHGRVKALKFYLTSFLISPSNTAVMTAPTAHARMYKSGCPTVANTKIPP